MVNRMTIRLVHQHRNSELTPHYIIFIFKPVMSNSSVILSISDIISILQICCGQNYPTTSTSLSTNQNTVPCCHGSSALLHIKLSYTWLGNVNLYRNELTRVQTHGRLRLRLACLEFFIRFFHMQLYEY